MPALKIWNRLNNPNHYPRGIIAASLHIGLPNLTFISVAEHLGVSQMALYKHVANVDTLKHRVAAEIFNRWQIPAVSAYVGTGLKPYLLAFTASLRALVKAHPGLAPFLIRRAAATPEMMAKITTHHRQIARAFGLSTADAKWLLSLIAFHCIAVADTVYSTIGSVSSEHAELEAEFELGMRALMDGALLRVKALESPGLG